MKPIPIEKFGKDHWSTFGYVVTVCYGKAGVPHKSRMRCCPEEHPGLNGQISGRPQRLWDNKYSSILKNGEKAPDGHDDWHCVEDLERHGLLRWRGSGMTPILFLTKRGISVGAALLSHKKNGGNFANFEVDWDWIVENFPEKPR